MRVPGTLLVALCLTLVAACGADEDPQAQPFLGLWVEDKSEAAMTEWLDSLLGPAGGPDAEAERARARATRGGLRAVMDVRADGTARWLKHPTDPAPRLMHWTRKANALELSPPGGDRVLTLMLVESRLLLTDN